jgi:hypothetical protein
MSQSNAAESPSQLFTRTALWALAREEAQGRRPARLTEANLATWTRFRGRLTPADLARLLVEDGAVTHPATFAAEAFLPTGLHLDSRMDTVVESTIAALTPAELAAPQSEYIQAQAGRLGVLSRFARSDLPKGIKGHHRVVELPGTGGQLAHHLCTTLEDVFLQDVFTVACGTWQERVLAGYVALDLGVAGMPSLWLDTDLVRTRESFGATNPDWILGLSPKRGGLYDEDTLRQRFPGMNPEQIVLI